MEMDFQKFLKTLLITLKFIEKKKKLQIKMVQ